MALTRVSGLGDYSIRKLLYKFGSAEAVLDRDLADLAAVNGIGPFKLTGLKDRSIVDQAEEELIYAENNDVRIKRLTTENKITL